MGNITSLIVSLLTALTMSHGFQLTELPVNGYGVAAFVVSIIAIAKLSQGSNVSIVYGRNARFLLELS